MFFLYTVRDNVKISPTHLLYDWGPTLHDEIDARYSNRVIAGVGLVICAVDILSCGDAILPPGDGAAFVDGGLGLPCAPSLKQCTQWEHLTINLTVFFQ